MSDTMKMKSILQDWVMGLPLRYQGTLLAAMRGCDSVPRECSAKNIIRAIRVACLNPADERELKYVGGYMSFNILVDFDPALLEFRRDLDHYPFHFVTHILHAIEVIGYTHPSGATRARFNAGYFALVRAFHLKPESGKELYERMTRRSRGQWHCYVMILHPKNYGIVL